MPLARTLLGLVTLAGAAAPVVAQPPAVWPAPKGPNRIVYPVPPWITNAPRTGIPPGAPMPTHAPNVSEVRFVAPGTTAPESVTPAAATTPVAPPAVVPQAPAPRVVVDRTPAPSATRPAPPATARPDVWSPTPAPTLPGTTVPARKGR